MSGKGCSRLRVFEHAHDLTRAAADLFLDTTRERRSGSPGTCAIALSGGSTPRPLYMLLGSEPYRSTVDWKRVHLFWADERSVPKEHPESNFKLVFDTLISRIRIPDANIHRIAGEQDPEQAARKYEQDLYAFFGTNRVPVFNLIILGIGADGHTASLFPGAPALKETVRPAVPVFSERKPDRITLTLPVLNNAERILFLASGRTKANVLAGIFGTGAVNEQYPAGLIAPHQGSLDCFFDKAAAEKLAYEHIS